MPPAPPVMSASVASTPGPPALDTTVRFGPRGRGCFGRRLHHLDKCRAGRQHRYGLAVTQFDGVTAGYEKKLEIVGVGYRAENRPFGLHLARFTVANNLVEGAVAITAGSGPSEPGRL